MTSDTPQPTPADRGPLQGIPITDDGTPISEGGTAITAPPATNLLRPLPIFFV